VTSPARPLFWPVALLVLAVNLLCMPADLYVGDPNAPRKEAIQLLNTGEWGIPLDERPVLGELAAVKGQYFWENAAKGRFFSKYGTLNTLLSLPPLAVERLLSGPLPLEGTSPRLFLFLNLYNVLLSLLLAFLLHRLFAAASASLWVPGAMVLACFYGTFLWHYLRAQTLEIFQVVAFTGFLERYFAHLRGPSPCRLRTASLWLSALTLLKFSYLLLFPAVALHAWLSLPDRRRETARALLAPLVAAVVVMGFVHKARFGGFLETGYGQWRVDGLPVDRFSWAGIPAGLAGFLFSPTKGIFLHFPALLAAAAGWPAFRRKSSREAAFLGGVFLLFLTALSGLSNWGGEACYGPRYLLFLSPALCLPSMESLPFLGRRDRAAAARIAGTLFVALLALSVRLQVYVNDLPFFFVPRIAGPFRAYKLPDVDRYFSRRPFGWVNRDAEFFLAGKRPFYPVERLSAEAFLDGKTESDRAVRAVRALATPNYFWKFLDRRRTLF
jgi:hypothetical protein